MEAFFEFPTNTSPNASRFAKLASMRLDTLQPKFPTKLTLMGVQGRFSSVFTISGKAVE